MIGRTLITVAVLLSAAPALAAGLYSAPIPDTPLAGYTACADEKGLYLCPIPEPKQSTTPSPAQLDVDTLIDNPADKLATDHRRALMHR